MPSLVVDTRAMKTVMKMAKAFGLEDLWLHLGEGKMELRAANEGRWAIVGMEVAGRQSGEGKRSVGLQCGKFAEAVKAARGEVEICWEGEVGPRAGVLTIKNGAKTRSLLMLVGEAVVRNVPDIPQHVVAELEVAELRAFLAEAEGVGNGNVGVEVGQDGSLKMQVGKGGDELLWMAGPAKGDPGEIGHWSATNWGQVLPEGATGALKIAFARESPDGGPGALRMDCQVEGGMCSVAMAALTAPEG